MARKNNVFILFKNIKSRNVQISIMFPNECHLAHAPAFESRPIEVETILLNIQRTRALKEKKYIKKNIKCNFSS